MSQLLEQSRFHTGFPIKPFGAAVPYPIIFIMPIPPLFVNKNPSDGSFRISLGQAVRGVRGEAAFPDMKNPEAHKKQAPGFFPVFPMISPPSSIFLSSRRKEV